MTHHVLEMYDCLDTTSWRRLFERNEVEPQFSRHGEDLSILSARRRTLAVLVV